MIRFSLLGSGSSGNATLVSTPGLKVLIDNGLSYRQLALRAAEVGETLEDIDAVLVTHEHGDHVAGLGVFARKRPVPIYMTEGTYRNLPDRLRGLEGIRLFEAGDTLPFEGAAIRSFSVPHDAADPVSYVVEAEGVRLGIACDMGKATSLVKMRLQNCHGLVLESNYCPDMLMQSSYPAIIRSRIHGAQGHLSNRDACSLLSSVMHDALRLVVLIHISDENNTHDRALDMARGVIRDRPVQLHVARKDKPTPMFELCP